MVYRLPATNAQIAAKTKRQQTALIKRDFSSPDLIPMLKQEAQTEKGRLELIGRLQKKIDYYNNDDAPGGD